MTLSTGLPAGTMTRIRRGRSSMTIRLAGLSAAATALPFAGPFTNACALAASRS